MGERGVAKTSMRKLAAACNLNVATLYHYFPSKAELVRALLADRRYTQRLADDQPGVDRSLPPGRRLEALLASVWDETLQEESVWRVLVSESIQGDESVRTAIGELIESVSDGLTGWITDVFPELADGPIDARAAARLVRTTLFALIVQELAVGDADARTAAADLAGAIFGG